GATRTAREEAPGPRRLLRCSRKPTRVIDAAARAAAPLALLAQSSVTETEHVVGAVQRLARTLPFASPNDCSTPSSRDSERVARGAGCGKSARPDLWGAHRRRRRRRRWPIPTGALHDRDHAVPTTREPPGHGDGARM